MIKIGKLEVIESHSLLIPKGDVVEISHDASDGNDFKLKILFNEEKLDDADSNKKKASFRVKPDGDSGILIFTNWNSSVGHTFKRPIEIGMLDSGRELFLLASSTFIGGVHKASIQFMLGDKK